MYVENIENVMYLLFIYAITILVILLYEMLGIMVSAQLLFCLTELTAFISPRIVVPAGSKIGSANARR